MQHRQHNVSTTPGKVKHTIYTAKILQRVRGSLKFNLFNFFE